MGYCVSITLENVYILAKNVPPAIKALLQLMGAGEEDPVPDPDPDDDIGPGFEDNDVEREKERDFEWVANSEVIRPLRDGDLIAAIGAWRYSCSARTLSDIEKLANMTEHTDIEIDCFNGEKWGNDADFWCAIAPFIEEGAVVTMHGEDDAYWRYKFSNGSYTEQTGHIEWE